MAADVGYLVRILSRREDDRTAVKDSGGPKSTVALMTRDLLGGGDQSLELDLDLQVPTGWEKRLDLKSGKVYLQHRDSTTHPHQSNQRVARLQDLNFPPAKPLLSLFDDTSLELNLLPTNSSFQSVCTLDKVKSALERAVMDSKKRKSPDDDAVCDRNASAAASPVAAGCAGCLSYVLVMKNNPKCPRCHSFVPLSAMKKPKLDLNISI